MSHSRPMVVYANHADFSGRDDQVNPIVMSRLCLWCKGGRGKVIINEEEFDFRSGDYLFLPWGFSIHYIPDPTSPFFLAGIHLIPNMDLASEPKEYWYQVPHHPDDPLLHLPSRRDTPLAGLEGLNQFHLQPDDPLMLLSEAIVAHFQSSGRDPEQLQSLSKVLIHHLQQATSLQDIPPKLRELLVHVDDHLSEIQSVGSFADFLDLSESQTRRLFQKWLSLSPLEFLSTKRVDKAASLLASTRLSIEEIALSVGYEDPFYFSRVFKKFRSKSPSSHRKDTGFL